MFSEPQVDYTETKRESKSSASNDHPDVFLSKFDHVYLYTNDHFKTFNILTGCSTPNLPRIQPAPKSLKHAMARSSSRGISKALSNL